MAWHGAAALTFDVYGTLIDWRTGVAGVLVPWAAENGVGAGREDLLNGFLECEGARQRAEPELRYPQILELQLDAPKREMRPTVQKLLAQGKVEIVNRRYRVKV